MVNKELHEKHVEKLRNWQRPPSEYETEAQKGRLYDELKKAKEACRAEGCEE